MACRYVLERGTALLQLRSPPVNSLGLDLRMDLMRGLENAIKDKADAIILFGAGKSFCAGADIAEFARQKHLQHPSLNEVITALDEVSVPTVAGLHGFTLGGGLELALACHYRVADTSTVVGLPEVHLGLLPGAGGTQRLPRLVGVPTALEIMTSGRHIKVHDAMELGLVDGILMEEPPALAEIVAFARIPSTISLDGGTHFTADTGRLRGLKAPTNIFKCVQVAAKLPDFNMGMQFERRSFDDLAAGSQARALQYAFFAEKRRKHHLSNLKSDLDAALAENSVEMEMISVAQREVLYLESLGVSKERIEKALMEQVGWVPPLASFVSDVSNDLTVIPTDVSEWSGAEITARILFPMVNAGMNIIGKRLSQNIQASEQLHVNPDEIDISFLFGTKQLGTFPRHHGGPFFWAEKVVGLRNVNMKLKELNEEQPQRKSYEPSGLLVDVVQSSSTLMEDIYFRKQQE
eukprot:GSChrysophyteH1.ASY1.ANO1.3205.1 assembled CDS